MYLIIVGAGYIGSQIINRAAKDNHELVVIEKSDSKAEEISKNFDCRIVNGDATREDVLKNAGIEEADALITATNSDAASLIIMKLARRYGVPRLGSIIRDTTSESLFHELSVDVAVNPYRLLVDHLYLNVQGQSISDFIRLKGGATLIELKLDKRTSIIGKTIMDATKSGIITSQMIIVSIYRKGKLMIPHGNTQFKIGDTVTILSRQEISNNLIRAFTR